MTRDDLILKTDTLKNETREALQEVIDNLNKGQKQKLLKNEKIKALLDRYGVLYED